jgi:hypothetical protein
MNGVSNNRHGVDHGPNKVPERLQQFSAEFLSNGKSGQVLCERTLDTKDLGEATIRAMPVLVKLDRILRAEALSVERPVRTTVEKREVANPLCCCVALRHRIGALDNRGVQT